MPPTDTRKRCRRTLPVAPAILLVAGLGGCDMPNFPGPQIQSPPPAFYRQSEAYQQRRLFPDLELLHHDAWVETSDGNFSGIYIDGYPGVLGEADVIRAQTAAIAAESRPVSYGAVLPVTIDQRRAWGWSEILQTPERGIQFVAFRAVVSYDTISYAIEFLAGDPGFKVRPDSVRKIVETFAVGRTEWNVPLIAVLAGMGLFGVHFARTRAEEKRRRLQSITLKKVPKKEETEGEGGGAEAADAQADPAAGAAPAGSTVGASAPSATTAAAAGPKRPVGAPGAARPAAPSPGGAAARPAPPAKPGSGGAPAARPKSPGDPGRSPGAAPPGRPASGQPSRPVPPNAPGRPAPEPGSAKRAPSAPPDTGGKPAPAKPAGGGGAAPAKPKSPGQGGGAGRPASPPRRPQGEDEGSG